MPWFACPNCLQRDMIEMHLSEYESDTNYGGFPEIKEMLCDCHLTPEQEDSLYVEAMGLKPQDWERQP